MSDISDTILTYSRRLIEIDIEVLILLRVIMNENFSFKCFDFLKLPKDPACCTENRPISNGNSFVFYCLKNDCKRRFNKGLVEVFQICLISAIIKFLNRLVFRYSANVYDLILSNTKLFEFENELPLTSLLKMFIYL